MSNRAQNWGYKAGPEVHGAARLVLWRLCDYADEYDTAYPSIDRLAGDCNIERANVVRALRRLEDYGYLRKIEQGGRISKRDAKRAGVRTTYLANRYQLLIAEPRKQLPIPPDRPIDAADEPVDNAAQLTLEGCRSDTPDDAQGCRTARAGVSLRAGRGVVATPQPSLEPSCEPAMGSLREDGPVDNSAEPNLTPEEIHAALWRGLGGPR